MLRLAICMRGSCARDAKLHDHQHYTSGTNSERELRVPDLSKRAREHATSLWTLYLFHVCHEVAFAKRYNPVSILQKPV